MPIIGKKKSADKKKGVKISKEARAQAAEKFNILQRNEELKREIQYSAEAVRRHEKKWREMLHRIAVPQLRNEVEYAWHIFEYIIDSKDFTISLLLDELTQSDQQYERKVKAQVDNIDRLITLYIDQINDIWEESRKVIMALYKAATFESKAVLESVMDHEDYLKTMLYSQDEQRKERTKIDRGAYLAQLEVENTKLYDVTSRYIGEVNLIWQKMWNEAEAFHKQFTEEFRQRKEQFFALDAQDQEVTNAIRNSWHKIGRHYAKIKNLKDQFGEFETKQNRAVKDLATEANYYEKQFRLQQKLYDEERALDKENLTSLCLQSNEIINTMKEIEKKGTKLLSFSDVCRKLETKEEKILSFPLYEDKTSNKKNFNHESDQAYKDMEIF